MNKELGPLEKKEENITRCPSFVWSISPPTVLPPGEPVHTPHRLTPSIGGWRYYYYYARITSNVTTL